MDWPTASVILGILATIAVAIIKFIPSKNRSGNPSNPSNAVSEKVCKAQMKAQEASIRNVYHRIKELENNLGGRIGNLETSINNLIAKMVVK